MTPMPTGAILVIGASLSAERVVHLVRQLPDSPTILGLIAVDRSVDRIGQSLAELPVLDYLEGLSRFRSGVVGAIPAGAEPAEQETIIAALTETGIPPLSVVHPTAWIGEDVSLSAGAVVDANASVDAGVRVGRGTVIGVGSIVGATGRIGDYAEVGPGVVIGPEARIGERVRLGLGSRVANGVMIGPDSVVAPGSLVVEDVPSASIMAGNPAKAVDRARHPEVDPA